MVTLTYPAFIRAPAVWLIGDHCFSELLENLRLDNVVCLKHVLAKGLGFGIVLGGAIVKLPQIYKIVSSGSVEGLSLAAFALETASLLTTVSYNHRGAFPFSTYGESFFLSLQNLIILMLLFAYRSRQAGALVALAVASVATYALNTPAWVGTPLLATLQAATIPISLASRIPQIVTNYRNGHTGQLAAFTVFNSFLGCAVRVFTTLHEVQDPILLLGFILATCLHGILSFQMLYYWNARKDDYVSLGMDTDRKKTK
ncbi:hypothetical protein H4R34_001086 [Dimargaris verticillata]|uniref:Mannose-P-dolichol utilization defect 1 protein homolog n=1 Tax=Dimargaris verticillata TaxID=2761393 RepID=A0A9W8B537_9FUNG|nr:hypothetical protein H4R34_001086 [Dimargaris verticillata]